MGKLPARIRWAVELLDIRPDDRILDLGFGPGVSLELIAERLGDKGQVVGIDRSATAVVRAEQRLAAQIATNRLVVEQVDLAGYDRADDRFDKALGVNVNVFWTGTADAELATLTRVLRPDGVLHLVYESPGGRPTKVVGPATANLERHGFDVEVVDGPTSNLLALLAKSVQKPVHMPGFCTDLVRVTPAE